MSREGAETGRNSRLDWGLIWVTTRLRPCQFHLIISSKMYFVSSETENWRLMHRNVYLEVIANTSSHPSQLTDKIPGRSLRCFTCGRLPDEACQYFDLQTDQTDCGPGEVCISYSGARDSQPIRGKYSQAAVTEGQPMIDPFPAWKPPVLLP